MSKKNIAILIFLVSLNQVVFSMSPLLESLTIYNYTDEEIVVSVVFQDGLINAVKQKKGYDNSRGLKIKTYHNILPLHNQVVRVRPNRYLRVIKYYPYGESDPNSKLSPYDQLDQVPFMEKMNTFFKKLEIVSEYGTITLDNLGDFLVKKVDSGGGRGYDLEISYQTLNGFDIGYKPGSEW